MSRVKTFLKAVRQRSPMLVTPGCGLIIAAAILVQPAIGRYLTAALFAGDVIGRFIIRDQRNDHRGHENGRSL